MRDNILASMENVAQKSKMEVSAVMTTDIMETLPWIDYREVFEKIEERGRAEGKAETQKDVAVKAFTLAGRYGGPDSISKMLKDIGVPSSIIEDAKAEADRLR